MKIKRLSIPYALWLIAFVVIPFILVAYFSLTTGDGEFTLEGYKRIFDPLYIKVIWQSFKLAFISTVICVIIGYPVAYILAKKEFIDKGFLIFLFVAPMWLNSLVRTYSWLTILENNGLVNNFLVFLGFERIKLLYTDFSVILGMVYNFLPFMILPIFTVLRKIDGSLLEAASDLGATWKQSFRRIILPLSMGGVLSGSIMVFMPALTTFIISNLLGGGQYMLIGNLIEQQFLRVGDWTFGSALSIMILSIILLSMILIPDDETNRKGGLF
ncbi:MAG: ABC transporter permease [Lachnospirales bacterium]